MTRMANVLADSLARCTAGRTAFSVVSHNATVAQLLLVQLTVCGCKCRQYLEALLDRIYGEGYSCLNAFQYLNVSQVRPV